MKYLAVLDPEKLSGEPVDDPQKAIDRLVKKEGIEEGETYFLVLLEEPQFPDCVNLEEDLFPRLCEGVELQVGPALDDGYPVLKKTQVKEVHEALSGLLEGLLRRMKAWPPPAFVVAEIRELEF